MSKKKPDDNEHNVHRAQKTQHDSTVKHNTMHKTFLLFKFPENQRRSNPVTPSSGQPKMGQMSASQGPMCVFLSGPLTQSFLSLKHDQSDSLARQQMRRRREILRPRVPQPKQASAHRTPQDVNPPHAAQYFLSRPIPHGSMCHS